MMSCSNACALSMRLFTVGFERVEQAHAFEGVEAIQTTRQNQREQFFLAAKVIVHGSEIDRSLPS